jgi:hypothetical protein
LTTSAKNLVPCVFEPKVSDCQSLVAISTVGSSV